MNHWHKCTICGKADVQLYHAYDNSCDATCNVCGYIRQIEHNYSVNYYADDNSHWRVCSICGDKADYESHAWDDGVVTKTPTCTETGVRTYTCSLCGKKKTETIGAKGHTVISDVAVPVTCTTDGMTAGSHCYVCGITIVEQDVIPALGHNYQSVVFEPTCTSEGYTVHTCSICGEGYIDNYTDMLSHTPGEWETDIHNHWHNCTACGAQLDVSGHSYDDDQDAVCNVCGYERTKG